MDPNVSYALDGFFLATTALTVVLLFLATRSRALVIVCVVWLVIASAVSLTGFFTLTRALPPRLILALGPPVLLAFAMPFSPAGRRFIDRMDLRWTILLHTVRILVEIALFRLYLAHAVPALMTFEGGNIDILAGLTAPLAWWAYGSKRVAARGLLAWNVVCMLTLLNAVVRALLSAPFPFQRFAFTQPNVAILYFPFLLLPAFVVPAVLFCHIAIFRKLRSTRLCGVNS